MSVCYFSMWVDISGINVDDRSLVDNFSRDVEIIIQEMLRSDRYKDMNFRDFAHDVDVDVEDIAGQYNE